MIRACVFLVALTSFVIVMTSCTPSGASDDVVERTLAMIKPDAVRAGNVEAIKQIIEAEGFKVVAEKEALFDDAGAQSFYREHSERSFFPQLVEFMTSGRVRVLVLEKQNAIKGWRALMGPTDSNKARVEVSNSVRAKFGLDGQSNCVHGSDSPEAAAREIAHFFDDIVPGVLGKSKTPRDQKPRLLLRQGFLSRRYTRKYTWDPGGFLSEFLRAARIDSGQSLMGILLMPGKNVLKEGRGVGHLEMDMDFNPTSVENPDTCGLPIIGPHLAL